MNLANARSVKSLLNISFHEMVELLNKNQEHDLTIRNVERDEIEATEFGSVMFTIASSTFRLSLILHFSDNIQLEGNFATQEHLNSSEDILQQNHDYLCELGNNLCGAMTRLIGKNGFSTGMSTPVTLQITQSTKHMLSIEPGPEAHIGCYYQENALIFASLYLFANEGHEDSLIIEISEQLIAHESSGELEFF